jgi:predicted nicotinamide N-methyase
VTTGGRTIGDFAAVLTHATVGDDAIALWQVENLAQHVDRNALLAADDPPEPPYWAHLWTGARVLAALVPPVETAIDLGCGLGLVGLAAARRGARVTCVDRSPAALAFVRASAAANDLALDLVAADFLTPVVRGRFDLVLAAEVLYDRTAFAPLARTLAALLKPEGRALIADAHRIDTNAFYADLDAANLHWRATDHTSREEGLPLTVRVVEITLQRRG